MVSPESNQPVGCCSRRRLLLAGVTAISIAGCADDPYGEAGGDDSDENGARRYTLEDHPIDEPVAFIDEQECTVCSMTVTDYPDWMGQLAHDDGTGKFFCSPGCLVAYYAAPDHPPFEGSDRGIVAAWTSAYGTGELIDATEASFVLDRERATPNEPMAPNPRPFADHEMAAAFVDDRTDLSGDDVVDLAAFDLELARLYREPRLP